MATLTGPASASASATAAVTDWWLKDTAVPGNSVKVRVTSNPQSQPEKVATFEPLGRTRKVAVADTLLGRDGSLVIFTRDLAERAAVVKVLNSQNTLLLQRPNGEQEHIRIVGPRERVPRGAGGRVFTVEYIEVDPPS